MSARSKHVLDNNAHNTAVQFTEYIINDIFVSCDYEVSVVVK